MDTAVWIIILLLMLAFCVAPMLYMMGKRGTKKKDKERGRPR